MAVARMLATSRSNCVILDLAITAIIPTYNRAGQVGNAIQSALSQTHPPLEIIVADDGSTDSTREVVGRFENRVKYLFGPNRGKAATLNRAIAQATGDWIAVLDDDDTWSEDKLKKQCQALALYPECKVCFTNSGYVNFESGPASSFERVSYKHASPYGILTNSIEYVLSPPHGIFLQSCLVNKELVVRAGGFDERLRAADDTDMIFKLSLLTQFCYVNEPLTKIDRTPVRTHGITDSRKTRPEVYLNDKDILYTSWFGLAQNQSTSILNTIAARHAEVYNAWGNLHISRGEYSDAIYRYRRAKAIYPRFAYSAKIVLAKYFPALFRLTGK